uniref:SET domain-containing protein 5 n=2 Tax=Caligus rogercresseyi TaxID=217165 RepID=C1BMJ5_CALRO|nr:SET domain-containing protein 5 [Caligus rogercresseyi]
MESSSSYEIVSLPGKGGKGVVARRGISAGEVIIREKPFLRISNEVFEGDTRDIDDALTEQLDAKSAADREMFFNLLDSRNSQEDKSILGIFFTNDMSYIQDSAALFPTMARVNHSCAPNADFITREHLDCQDLVATEDIRAGEEITLSYLPSKTEGTAPGKIRRAYLRLWYQFDCLCRICRMDNRKIVRNDRLRRKVKSVQSKMEDDSIFSLSHEELVTLSENLNLIRGVKLPYMLGIFERILEAALEYNDIRLAAKLIARGVTMADILGDIGFIRDWEDKRNSSLISIGGRLYLFPQEVAYYKCI